MKKEKGMANETRGKKERKRKARPKKTTDVKDLMVEESIPVTASQSVNQDEKIVPNFSKKRKLATDIKESAVAQCRVMNQQGETNLVSTTSEENYDKENTELTDIKVCSVPSLQVTLKCEEDEGDTRSTSSEICENNGPDVLSETAKDNCEITENSENKNMADTSVISREVQKTKNEQCPELSVKIDTSNEQITSLSRNTAENITTSLNRNTAENETLNKQNNSIEKSISDCEIDGQIKDFDNVNVVSKSDQISIEQIEKLNDADETLDDVAISYSPLNNCSPVSTDNVEIDADKSAGSHNIDQREDLPLRQERTGEMNREDLPLRQERTDEMNREDLPLRQERTGEMNREDLPLKQERTDEMNREDLPLKQERTNVIDEDLNVKTRLSSDALNITGRKVHIPTNTHMGSEVIKHETLTDAVTGIEICEIGAECVIPPDTNSSPKFDNEVGHFDQTQSFFPSEVKSLDPHVQDGVQLIREENNLFENTKDTDEISDSQLCSIEWVDEVTLPVKCDRKLLPRQQDGTTIIQGLIKELSQLNTMILRTKREFETARRQFRQCQTTDQQSRQNQSSMFKNNWNNQQNRKPVNRTFNRL